LTTILSSTHVYSYYSHIILYVFYVLSITLLTLLILTCVCCLYCISCVLSAFLINEMMMMMQYCTGPHVTTRLLCFGAKISALPESRRLILTANAQRVFAIPTSHPCHRECAVGHSPSDNSPPGLFPHLGVDISPRLLRRKFENWH